MRRGALICIVAAALSSCAGAGLAEGTGQGVVSFDRNAPTGSQLHERPTWEVGDRFVYRRAGVLQVPLRVTDRGDDGYVLTHEQSGVQTLLDQDLGLVGLDVPGDPQQTRREAPSEALLHWPLWVGKRWSCHFYRKRVGEPILPLHVSYHCDRVETVTVPAGTFECLRIWRRARVAAEGDYMEVTSLLWYSPEVGYFARRLENGSQLELLEYHRQ